jgi:putative toxin-antitoxin system antitoxin component (TIGR02293 family)
MSPRTRAQTYEDLKDLRRRGELQQVKDTKGVLETLATIGYKELKKKGVFLVPGFAKFVVIKKPGTKARKGVNPFTGEAMAFKVKPARKLVQARPIKDAALAAETRPSATEAQKLFRFLEIEALADRVFGDEKKANIWLQRPNGSMSGQIPLDLMKDELGAAVVREALEQIDHGIFA